LAIDFVVESNRAQLSEIVQRVRDGRLRTNIGTVAALNDAVGAFNPTERRKGKTIDCGFADQSHFSRVFSRLVGQNPGAWRRIHATTLADATAIAAHRANYVGGDTQIQTRHSGVSIC
jgi:hypothetical protein